MNVELKEQSEVRGADRPRRGQQVKGPLPEHRGRQGCGDVQTRGGTTGRQVGFCGGGWQAGDLSQKSLWRRCEIG